MGYFGAFGGINTTLFGTDADAVFGKKPVIPTLPSLTDAQKTAVAGNNANFADIAKLATSTNTFNQDQLNAMLDKVLGPGVRQQFQQNLASEARGEIPQDVQNAIYRGTAERSAATNAFGGGGDGGFARNVTARDLGLTSLDITNKALSSAESWLQSAKAPTFDVTSMFITPAQQNTANTDQFNRNLLAAKTAAAPDPAIRGQFDTTQALIGEVLSAYGGGPGYQNTYKPSYEGLGQQGGGGGGGMYVPQSQQSYQNYYSEGNGGLANAGNGGGGGKAAPFFGM